MRKRSSIVVFALVMTAVGCKSESDDKPDAKAKPAETAVKSETAETASKEVAAARTQWAKAKEKLRAVEDTIRTQPTDAWPPECDGVEGDVLLVTYLQVRRLLGASDESEHEYNDHQLAPEFLTKLRTDQYQFTAEQSKYLQPLIDARLLGVLRITGHKAAELFTKDGKPISAGDVITEHEFQFKPGNLDAWLYVVEADSGKGVCAVKARAKHEKDFSTKAAIGDGPDSYLRRALAQALAKELASAGAQLTDGSVPVADSPRYKPQAATGKP